MVETTELRQPLVNEYVGREDITFLPYSMGQNLSTGANRFAASQEIPSFYATRRFITAFTNARHLRYPEPVRSSPYHYILTQ